MFGKNKNGMMKDSFFDKVLVIAIARGAGITPKKLAKNLTDQDGSVDFLSELALEVLKIKKAAIKKK